MLAYAFWHWRRSEVDSGNYESHQRAFQAALALHPPEGFQGATTVKFSGAPWAAGGGEAYEDWYLVRGMSDLEGLNQAAVTAARQLPHDAVARLAAGGTAGLYGLEAGTPLTQPVVSSWFSKPAGMTYPVLLESLQSVVIAASGALWMRRMVLGPTAEFCLHTGASVELPSELEARSFLRVPVWPGAGAIGPPPA